MKAFVLNESDTGYVSEFQIYTGRPKDGSHTKDLDE